MKGFVFECSDPCTRVGGRNRGFFAAGHVRAGLARVRLALGVAAAS